MLTLPPLQQAQQGLQDDVGYIYPALKARCVNDSKPGRRTGAAITCREEKMVWTADDRQDHVCQAASTTCLPDQSGNRIPQCLSGTRLQNCCLLKVRWLPAHNIHMTNPGSGHD